MTWSLAGVPASSSGVVVGGGGSRGCWYWLARARSGMQQFSASLLLLVAWCGQQYRLQEHLLVMLVGSGNAEQPVVCVSGSQTAEYGQAVVSGARAAMTAATTSGHRWVSAVGWQTGPRSHSGPLRSAKVAQVAG